jgi:hypothetical protein
MSNSYIQAVTRGMIIGGVLLGGAGTFGMVFFVTLFLTQSRLLVVWLPVVALALFTVGILVLLRRDAKAIKLR